MRLFYAPNANDGGVLVIQSHETTTKATEAKLILAHNSRLAIFEAFASGTQLDKPRTTPFRRVYFVSILILAFHCYLQANSLIEDDSHVFDSTHYQFRIETVAQGLNEPWGIALLPDGRFVATEQSGTLLVFDNSGKLLARIKKGFPKIMYGYRQGLMDVKAHPHFANQNWLYFTYADVQRKANRSPASFTALGRARLTKDNKLLDFETLWQTENFASPGKGPIGSRIAIDDQHVYFTTGDRKYSEFVQRIDTPHGKILRLTLDGEIPQDNPLANKPNTEQATWSMGHRNPQGLTFEPLTGLLYSTEHGPRGGDEINLIVKGKNYGWPVVGYGTDYDGTSISETTESEGSVSPIYYWSPSVAPAGIDFYQGSPFQKWEGDLLVSTLAAEELIRVRIIKGSRVIHLETLFKWQGRVRDVLVNTDGEIYVVFNNPGRIAKLVPTRDKSSYSDQRKARGKTTIRRTSLDDAVEQKWETLKQKRKHERDSQSEGLKLVQQNCSSCHGQQLQGGSAPALRASQLKYTKTPADLRRIIEYGIPETDMPAMGAIFDEIALQALIDYLSQEILEKLPTDEQKQ